MTSEVSTSPRMGNLLLSATRLLALASALCLSIACAPTPAPLDISDYRLIDLSHTFDEKTLYWPTDKHFEHSQVAWGRTEGGFWYSSFTYGGSEHGGTHIDAPIHFGEGKRSVDQIPIEQLIGSAVVIDIAAACYSDPDYLLTAEDIEIHEQRHGRIEHDSIVMIRTGWSRRWPDAKQYLGSNVPGDTQNLHFPGVSPEAAGALVERNVAIVGIDTASIDHWSELRFQGAPSLRHRSDCLSGERQSSRRVATHRRSCLRPTHEDRRRVRGALPDRCAHSPRARYGLTAFGDRPRQPVVQVTRAALRAPGPIA